MTLHEFFDLIAAHANGLGVHAGWEYWYGQLIEEWIEPIGVDDFEVMIEVMGVQDAVCAACGGHLTLFLSSLYGSSLDPGLEWRQMAKSRMEQRTPLDAISKAWETNR